MAEISTVLLTETQNYPFEAFLSDTGGAAGLFLGLHILGKNIITKLLNSNNQFIIYDTFFVLFFIF